MFSLLDMIKSPLIIAVACSLILELVLMPPLFDDFGLSNTAILLAAIIYSVTAIIMAMALKLFSKCAKQFIIGMTIPILMWFTSLFLIGLTSEAESLFHFAMYNNFLSLTNIFRATEIAVVCMVIFNGVAGINSCIDNAFSRFGFYRFIRWCDQE